MFRVNDLALGMFLVTALCSCGHSDAPSGSSLVLRRGIGGDISTLDPAAVADTFSAQVLQDLYEGLTTESSTGDVLPAVAASWTVDAGGKEYTFHLRSDARWSNGKPVRAQEFVAAWRRVVDPKQGSPAADNLRLIAGASDIIAGRSPPTSLGIFAPTDDTLVVKLEQPASYLPQLLTHSFTYPVYSDDSARSHKPENWVSNGAYVLANWQQGTRVELTKNSAYWNQTDVHITRVEYQVASDQNSQVAQYRAGQLDMTDTVPPNAIPALRRANSTELLIAPFLGTVYYGVNIERPPFAANPSLRQALAMAIDRKRLVDALAFGQTGAFGFVPPSIWNYQPQSWSWKPLGDAERIAEAKRLYAKAGYSEAKPLRLRLLYNSNTVIKQTAIIIAAMWKETLGIDTEYEEEEYRVFLETRHDKSRWDVARLGWTADFNDAGNFLDTLRTNSKNNDEGYANPAYDKLLDEAASAADPTQRRELLEAGERLMLADYPIIPLYHFVSKRLIKPYVHGVEPDPFDRIPTKTLTIVAH
jgi:ABC-type oligopeptide transport system substrate-binding subunit